MALCTDRNTNRAILFFMFALFLLIIANRRYSANALGRGTTLFCRGLQGRKAYHATNFLFLTGSNQAKNNQGTPCSLLLRKPLLSPTWSSICWRRSWAMCCFSGSPYGLVLGLGSRACRS